ncbi:oxalurate catabolism protein HpxX [Kosakonia sp. SMBL-WEM22]|uniref:oxalurate catabolism protein HpxX n=1 Tax=Kosakonia sp. SMBL-WEM22 TaxID=2725560 RepID=UPI0016594757|nr:oxalurate catabolism protein HpxX [Kosakonia sp. SMBL-WEM22]
MNNDAVEWKTWVRLMEQILDVPLDDARRTELEVQLARIAAMAQPLMQFPLPPRQEGAGEYRL